MLIPLATLSEADVVGLTSSGHKTDACFVVILVHGKGDDLALSGSYLSTVLEKASGKLKIKMNFLSSARKKTNVLKFAEIT